MSDELVFYTNPMSRGRIVRWMLEEVGTSYRTEILEFGTTMKAPEYRAINPMGKVPAIRHGNTIVTVCAAICAYLADAFPAAAEGVDVVRTTLYHAQEFLHTDRAHVLVTEENGVAFFLAVPSVALAGHPDFATPLACALRVSPTVMLVPPLPPAAIGMTSPRVRRRTQACAMSTACCARSASSTEPDSTTEPAVMCTRTFGSPGSRRAISSSTRAMSGG